jgi:hypothetical protein
MTDAHSALMTTIAQAWNDATRQHDAHMYDYALHNISKLMEEMAPTPRDLDLELANAHLDGIAWLADHKRDHRKHES